MAKLVAPTPFVVVLIPDELQVEDRLWRQVGRGIGAADRDRDGPQRRLREGLSRAGIDCLDLLPAFLAIPPLDDGSRHLYMLRNTHFNVRGNAVAGEALVGFLAKLAPVAHPFTHTPPKGTDSAGR